MIKEGDTIAEEIIYKKYSILIAKRIRDFNLTSDFDDYFQESLIVLARSIDTYIDSRYGFYPYFYKNLTNRLISIIRSKNSKRKLDIMASDEVLELKDPGIIVNYNVKENEIFKGLSEQEMNIVNKIYLDKMSTKEVADLYGTKEEKVYYILKKAKDKIRKNCIESGDFY